MKLRIIACLMLLGSACMAQDVVEKPVATIDVQPKLRSELSAWEPYFGTWVIDAKLKDGGPLWSKKQYKVGLDGNFVMVETFARYKGGKSINNLTLSGDGMRRVRKFSGIDLRETEALRMGQWRSMPMIMANQTYQPFSLPQFHPLPSWKRPS
jgi:hypothetical protein